VEVKTSAYSGMSVAESNLSNGTSPRLRFSQSLRRRRCSRVHPRLKVLNALTAPFRDDTLGARCASLCWW
jgi:hypothetical protein